MKQTTPKQTILVFRFSFQENKLRLSIPPLFSGLLLQVKTVTGQSNSGGPRSLSHCLHSEYVHTLQS